MKSALSVVCVVLILGALVGSSPQFFVQGNPFAPPIKPVILLTPENISRPLEPQRIPLTLFNTENASRGYPPVCSLILHEANLNSFRFTLRVVTTALHWQSENVEAWLIVDDRAPVKLDRSALDKKTGLALVGAIFTSDYDSSLSGLGEGCHVIKIRVLSPLTIPSATYPIMEATHLTISISRATYSIGLTPQIQLSATYQSKTPFISKKNWN